MEIKRGLAQLLAGKIHSTGVGENMRFLWSDRTDWVLRDTEWDSVCHLLESQMTPEELDTYYYDFLHVKDEDHAYAAIANWEKRGPAILRFRGIVK